jgi:pimeloyl-ACP methyl ester carboxylesterase
MSEAPPGFGFTPREHSAMLEQFVDHLGLRNLIIMVQDWGVRPALAWLHGDRSSFVR